MAIGVVRLLLSEPLAGRLTCTRQPETGVHPRDEATTTHRRGGNYHLGLDEVAA